MVNEIGDVKLLKMSKHLNNPKQTSAMRNLRELVQLNEHQKRQALQEKSNRETLELQPPEQQLKQQQEHQTMQQEEVGPSASGSHKEKDIGIPEANEVNSVTLSRLGLDAIRDVVGRMQEMTNILQLPSRDKESKNKILQSIQKVQFLMKLVRTLFDKCNCVIDQTDLQSHIPFEDDEHVTVVPESEEYQKALQENVELIQMVKFKNLQLHEIIEKLRQTVWEIDTMLLDRRHE